MIRVTIPTYNRPDKLARLIAAIDCESVNICVYDDGSDPPARSDVATVYRYDENAGKTHWYLRVLDMMEDARDDPEWDYLLWLPDDVWPTDECGPTTLFVPLVELAFDSLREVDPDAVCLNPFALPHHPCEQWTQFEPVERFGFYQTQWMDCAGIVDRRFVDVAIEALRGCNPAHVAGLSTGVGKRISMLAHKRGLTMYQTLETWLHHDGIPSRLQPDKEVNYSV